MNNPIIISIIMSVVITLLSELYYRYKYKDDISIDDKEKLKIAIESEDYETAAKLRDKMNSTIES